MTDNSNIATSPERPPRFSRKFLRNLLIASLAFNLLIVGSAGAMWARHAWHHGGMGRGLMGVARHIDGDRGQEIRALLRQGRESVRPLRQAVREKRRALGSILRAEALDPATVRAALDAMHEARNKVRETRASIFLNVLEKMTQQERVKFLDKLHRRHGGWWKKRHGGGPHRE